MTILIKGMKMPIEGEAVVLVLNKENEIMMAEVDEYCGAVYEAVPISPHGRLIDADDFDSRIRAAGGLADEELTDDFKDGVLSVLTLMKTQNTVIEAEEVNQ